MISTTVRYSNIITIQNQLQKFIWDKYIFPLKSGINKFTASELGTAIYKNSYRYIVQYVDVNNVKRLLYIYGNAELENRISIADNKIKIIINNLHDIFYIYHNDGSYTTIRDASYYDNLSYSKSILPNSIITLYRFVFDSKYIENIIINDGDNTKFRFDGTESDAMDVMFINMESGMLKQTLRGSISLNSELDTSNRISNIRLDKQPIEFNFLLAKRDGSVFTSEQKKNIMKWLLKDMNKEFINYENSYKIYYGIFTLEDFNHDGNDAGYFSLKFKTNAWHSWTPKMYSKVDALIESNTINLKNESNIEEYYYPLIQVELDNSTTSFTLTNSTDANKPFVFTNLTPGERILIDNKRNKIISSDDRNRFNNFNKNWLKLKKGDNIVTISKGCLVKVKFQFPII